MPDLELVRSQWAPGCWEIIYDVRYKSDLNIWINKFCPRIHGYRYTQKRWSSMIRDVWKSETFFTISSPGRQGVGGLSLWLGSGGITLYGRFIWSNLQLMADVRIGFDGSFINFTARHVSVLCGPHAVAHFPPDHHPSPGVTSSKQFTQRWE